jgi:Secretion system C-terminal sorting domain
MKSILILLFLFPTIVDGQSWQWAQGGTGTGQGGSGNYVATDQLGNVYLSGVIWGAVQYGSYSFPTVAGGYRRAVLIKHDSLGNVLWAKSTTGGDAFPFSITTDAFNNIYLLGVYDSTFNLDGHSLTNSYHANHPFIAKISPTGVVNWVKSIGNVVGYGGGFRHIATDACGNIYVNCYFSNNPTIGTVNLFNTDPTNNTTDILVAKFDTSGNPVWAKSYGGSKDDQPSGIAISPDGMSIYIDGNFYSDTLAFGSIPLTDTGQLTNNSSIFVAKLDNIGNPIWAKCAGGTSQTTCTYGLAISSSEDVFVAGYYSKSITFGSFTLNTFPWNWGYGFLAKYNSSGVVSWVKEMQGNMGSVYNVNTDPCDNVWITMTSISDTDTLGGHQIILPTADPSIVRHLFAQWTSTGSFLQYTNLPNSYIGCGLSFDQFNNLYISNRYNFPSGTDTIIIINDTIINPSRTANIFVAKYKTGNTCSVSNIPCGGETLIDKTLLGNHNFILYPNPTSKLLTITEEDRLSNITICNLLGQKVYTGNFDIEKVVIDVSNLPAGIYLIKINGKEVKKFVKQ